MIRFAFIDSEEIYLIFFFHFPVEFEIYEN